MACVINANNFMFKFKTASLKIILPLALVLIVLGVWLIVKDKSLVFAPENQKIKIVTTIFPLYDIAQEIGGDQVSAVQLLPPGVEAHHFEPRPSDLVKINQAQIFIYSGKVMEPWAEKMLQSLQADNLKVIDASSGISLIAANHSHEHGDNEDEKMHTEASSVADAHGEDTHEEDGGNELDPHFWLDFDNVKTMVADIAQGLSAVDPENTSVYQARAQAYTQRLTDLDHAYEQGLSACDSRQLTYGGHYTFGYLAQRYHLEYLAAQGLSPDAEPTARDLVILSLKAKSNAVPYVFYEELDNPKVAQTIAQESGAQLLPLNSAHNLSADQRAAGLSFIQVMENNLTNLRQGLGCK